MKASKLAQELAEKAAEYTRDFEQGWHGGAAAKLDDVLRPIRESLEKADNLMRLYGFNLDRRELRPVLESLEVPK